MRRRARRRYRKVLPIGQDVDGDEIDRALHVRIAQPKFPHVRIGDRHRHLRLDLANDGDEVCRRHFAAQQHFVADDDRRNDVRIVLGVGNGRRDLPAGPIRIAGDPHTVQHLQPVPPRALEHVVAAVVDRIGADAAGVFGEQRQIFVDLLGRDPGTLDQRVLRSTERGIGNASKLIAGGERRRRQFDRRVEPPPHRADRERGQCEGGKRRADGMKVLFAGHALPLTLQPRHAKLCRRHGALRWTKPCGYCHSDRARKTPH